MPARPLVLVCLAVATPLLLVACSSSGATDAAGSATTIAVAANDTTCVLDSSTADAGTVSFAVTNSGSQVTEVYVYGKNGDAFTSVVAEVEDIGPGTSRDMRADLDPGTYEVACKPGLTGDGVRATLTVEGAAVEGAAVAPAATSTTVAREVSLTIDATDQLTGADGPLGAAGERIEFEVSNPGSAVRVFEVKRPDGSVAGEIDVEAGQESSLTVELDATGEWLLIVEGGSTETETSATVS